jgi:MFS family permease
MDRETRGVWFWPFYILLVLLVTQSANYFDRRIVISLLNDIEQTLIQPTQAVAASSGDTFGKLGGLLSFLFMLGHSIFAIPMGILADRYSRKWLIALGMLCWTCFTLLCGLVTTFGQLALLRVLVGIGEASYGPAANSLLADSFPSRHRAVVIACFNVGMFLGSALGLYMGGLIADGLDLGVVFLHGFRHAFIVAGLPGIFLVWAVVLMREPQRQAYRSPLSFGILLQSRAFFSVVFAGVFISFAAEGLLHWMPYFVTNEFHISDSEAAVRIFVVAIPVGILGVLTGGYVADRLHVKTPHGRLISVILGITTSVPFLALALVQTHLLGFLIFAALGTFFMAWYNGPIVAILFETVEPHTRGTAYAIYLFVIHSVGTMFGGLVVGLVQDLTGSLRIGFTLPIAANLLSAILFVYVLMQLKRKSATLITSSRDGSIHDTS